MKTLKLFNAVVVHPPEGDKKPIVNTLYGIVVEPSATWAYRYVAAYYEKELLSGNDLNKTFHKSWKKILTSSREELFIHQVVHYISTYGSDFKDEVYIPDEILNIPDLHLTFKVVKGYTKEELTEKCLTMLRSGMALKEETIDDLFSILVDELDYTFTGKEGIKNKEAIIKLADMYGIIPLDTMEFFRYIIYRATGKSLLIKDEETIELIKKSSYNPGPAFRQHGMVKLSKIFNRFKPLFLAFKNKCPKTINKISKQSKVHHKPMVINPLNTITTTELNELVKGWLDNATPYALFKAFSALHTRINGQDSFVYRIRNGKSWVAEGEVKNKSILEENYMFLRDYLRSRFDFKGRKVFIPEGVDYAIPTSEKMFVGNIPTGTKFTGNKLAVGVYWENSWGASDLDLSGLNIGGKVGWNSAYNQNGNFLYSGDLTDARNGAVEYLYAKKGLREPTLVMNNVFSGQDDCEYKIIVGKGDRIDRHFMMNPNNLFMEVKTESVQKQTILGIFIPEQEGKQTFVLLNMGAGHARISGGAHANEATMALFQQYWCAYSFESLIRFLGAEIVNLKEEATHDFSLDKIEKDSFVKFFSE